MGVEISTLPKTCPYCEEPVESIVTIKKFLGSTRVATCKECADVIWQEKTRHVIDMDEDGELTVLDNSISLVGKFAFWIWVINTILCIFLGGLLFAYDYINYTGVIGMFILSLLCLIIAMWVENNG